MTLEDSFKQFSQDMETQGCEMISNHRIIALIDLTLLDKNASPEAIKSLEQDGQALGVAALCVLPKHLSLLDAKPTIKRATVVNFPTGNETLPQVLSTIEQIIHRRQADEIDYVFPYQAYLAGNEKAALEHTKACLDACKTHHVLFKVILETGALPSMETIYKISREVISLGCDFIKTSTGKIETGASPEAAFAMLLAIRDSKKACGFKVSGGIRSKAQAMQYIHYAEKIINRPVDPTWFRIGASSLIKELSTSAE